MRWVLAAVALAAACGASDDVRVGTSGGQGQVPVYAVTATVLESPAHGPKLCLGIAESYPPQCSAGFELVGWDWGAADGEESVDGTTWGDFRVVGTWDGSRFTPTEDPAPPRWDEQRDEPLDDATPCLAPEGGWAIVDSSRADSVASNALAETARADPGFAGLWLDHLPAPAPDGRGGPKYEDATAEPASPVFNVMTTGDVEAVTAELRAVWGGALCVSAAERTYAELRAIQDQLVYPEVLANSIDESGNVVDMLVFVADDDTVESYNERFGAYALRVRGWLTPVGETVAPTTTTTTPTTTDPSAAPGEGQPARSAAVRFEVLEVFESVDHVGALRAAVDATALGRLWSDRGYPGQPPAVDFDTAVVVVVTIPDDACPPELEEFERGGDVLTPSFREVTAGCDEPLIPKTFVVALDRASVVPSFTLRLPGDETYGYDEQRFVVDLTDDARGLPGVTVTLYHCGVNPLRYEGRDWEVPDAEQPFDATNAPPSFVGEGTIEQISADELRYTDASGLTLRFVPDDGTEPLCG